MRGTSRVCAVKKAGRPGGRCVPQENVAAPLTPIARPRPSDGLTADRMWPRVPVGPLTGGVMARGTVDNQRHAVEEWLKGLSLDAVSRKCHVSPRCVGRWVTAAGYDPLRPPPPGFENREVVHGASETVAVSP